MRVIATSLLSVLLAGCASGPDGTTDPATTTPEPELPRATYSWVWLHAGGAEETISQEDLEAAQAGHFASMRRLADDGELLLAGPLWPPRAVASHRGVFLFRRGSMANVLELAGSDPAVQAGLLRMEVEPFAADADLATAARRHAEWVAASGVEDPPPGLHSHGYVLLVGRPAVAARRALQASELPVLFHGTLGSGASLSELACLDYRSVDDLPGALPGGDTVAWTAMAWFSTEELGAL